MATVFAKPYASPLARARAIVADHARSKTDAPSEVLRHAERIVQFARQAPMVALDLERALAPWHVFRWVAWDPLVDGCRQRAKLAMYLHERLAGRRGGWLQERRLTAAFAAWEQAREAARKRGSIMPAVDQIPLDDYRRAIETAPRREKGAGAAAGEPAIAAAGAPELAEAVEPATAAAKRDDATPASASPQMRVVRHLALAVRTALEAHDLRAAQVANDAILQLVGELEADKVETESTSEQATSEQATPAQPTPSAARDTALERAKVGADEAAAAVAPAMVRAATDTRPLIDILLGK